MSMRTSTCVHAHIHLCPCAHPPVSMRTSTCVHAHIHLCPCAHPPVSMRTSTCVHVSIHLCPCVSSLVSMCPFTRGHIPIHPCPCVNSLPVHVFIHSCPCAHSPVSVCSSIQPFAYPPIHPTICHPYINSPINSLAHPSMRLSTHPCTRARVHHTDLPPGTGVFAEAWLAQSPVLQAMQGANALRPFNNAFDNEFLFAHHLKFF